MFDKRQVLDLNGLSLYAATFLQLTEKYSMAAKLV